MRTRFRFGADVADAMKGAQLGRLGGACKKTIKRLVRREIWATCTIQLMPDLPPILRPEFFTAHFFDLLQRSFVLAYHFDEERWVLNFAEKPEQKPPADADAQREEIPEQEQAQQEEAPARRRRQRRAAFAAIEGAWRGLTERSNAFWLAFESDVDEAVELVDLTIDAACASAAALCLRLQDKAQRKLAALYEAYVRRRSEVDAVLSRLKVEFDTAVDYQAQDGAHLETRSIALAPGVTVEVPTMVDDHIDWDSFPFGEPNQEEHALA